MQNLNDSHQETDSEDTREPTTSATTPTVAIDDALAMIEKGFDQINPLSPTAKKHREELRAALEDFAPKTTQATKPANRTMLALVVVVGLLSVFFSDNIIYATIALFKPRAAPRAEILTLPTTSSLPALPARTVQEAPPPPLLPAIPPEPKKIFSRPPTKHQPRAYIVTIDDVWDNTNTIGGIAHKRSCTSEDLRNHLKQVWPPEKFSSTVLTAGTTVPLPTVCGSIRTKP